jgi:hypothetical protein
MGIRAIAPGFIRVFAQLKLAYALDLGDLRTVCEPPLTIISKIPASQVK